MKSLLRMLGNASRTTLGAALVSLVCLSSDARAFPLERFDQQLDVTCAGDSSCARSLRAQTTLGAYTGIWVRGGGEMRSTVSVSKGTLKVHAEGPLVSGVQLSWDSDTYADQLSSSGLKCIDMRHQGGSAIIVEGFELTGVCGDKDAERECPPFVIETRIYDSADPTGQTYSASILRRSSGRPPQHLIIPFSNVNRKGLRGAGRLECAGAVSINVRTDGYRDVTLRAGPIFTNSTEPLEALVLTPTPTTAPTTGASAVTAGEESTGSRTSDAELVNRMTPPPTGAVLEDSVEGPTEQGAPRTKIGSEAVVAPLNSPEPRRRDEEEMVYGAIVSE